MYLFIFAVVGFCLFVFTALKSQSLGVDVKSTHVGRCGQNWVRITDLLSIGEVTIDRSLNLSKLPFIHNTMGIIGPTLSKKK